MAKEIHITVKADGTVKVEAQGFTGGSCRDATRAIERALGDTTTDTAKPELYEDAKKVSGYASY